MMTLYAVLLLSLVPVALGQLFPVGQKLEYSYHAHIRNTLDIQHSSIAEYIINANIHIVGFNNGSHISLHNITHIGHMGEHKLVNKTTNQAIPPETECLKLPFFIEHGINGKLINVMVDREDQLWSVNMKKAISSLLQLDFFKIDLTKRKPYSFYSDELLVHGHCQMQYDVVPYNKSSSTIKKWISSCKDQKWKKNGNTVNMGQCEVDSDNSVQQTSHRSYDVEWSNKAFIINQLESDGYTIFSPLNGKGGVHSVHVKQTMKKVNVLPASDDISAENLVPRGVKGHTTMLSSIVGSYPDLSAGRTTYDLDIIMLRMRESLSRLVRYLKTSYISKEEPNWIKGESVHVFFMHLQVLNYESLSHCYEILCDVKNEHDQEMLDVLHEILPYVGTYSSNIFIKDLIKNKKVNNELSIKMLQRLPFQVSSVDEKLLKGLSDFIHWGSDVDEEVESAAVLSFSNLLSKFLKLYPDNHTFEYVDHFINKFKLAKNYKGQVLYISALQNLGTQRVTKFLEPLILNYKTSFHNVTPQLRNLAIWAVRSNHVKDPDFASNIYWPILQDKSEVLEIRTSALSILMANPTIHSQMKIYSFMVEETDQDLYNIYYTTLQSLSSTASPCHRVLSINAKRILQYISNPPNASAESAVYQYDYHDSEFNLGSTIRGSKIGNIITHLSTAIYVEFSSHVSNLHVRKFGYYVKLTISKKIRDIIKTKTNNMSPLGILDIYTSMKQTKSENADDDFSLEYITLFGGHIVSVSFNNLNELRKVQAKRYDPLHSTYGIVDFDFGTIIEGRVYRTTDLGTLAYAFVEMPTTQMTNWYYEAADDWLQTFKFKIMQNSPKQYGLTVFDPISNGWYYNRRFLLVNSHLPVSFEMSVNKNEKMAKISFNILPSENMETKNFGLQAFVKTNVCYFDNENFEFIYHEEVTEKRKEVVMIEKNLEDVGLHLKLALFDCENFTTPSRLNHVLYNRFLAKFDKNSEDFSILKILLAMKHWSNYILLAADSGLCGMRLLVSPSPTSPATSADLSIQLLREEIPGTINLRTSYELKNKETSVKMWDFCVLSDYIENRVRNANINVTSTKPGFPDYKICANVKRTWENETITSVWNVLAGDSTDDSCPNDGMQLDVTVKNELSNEQSDISKSTSNLECDTRSSLQCMMAQSALRHCEVDANLRQAPENYDFQTLKTINDWIRSEYGHHFVRIFDEDKKTKEGNIKLTLDYPVGTDSVNLALFTPSECYKYEDLPIKHWYWTGLVRPYSTMVTNSQHIFNAIGITDMCEVRLDSFVNMYKSSIDFKVPKNWTLYAADFEDRPDWKIFVKKNEETNSLALRIFALDEELEIHIRGDFQFILNDKQLPTQKFGYRSLPPFDYKILQKENKVFVLIRTFDINLEYDANKITLHLPKRSVYKGLCYQIKDDNIAEEE